MSKVFAGLGMSWTAWTKPNVTTNGTGPYE